MKTLTVNENEVIAITLGSETAYYLVELNYDASFGLKDLEEAARELGKDHGINSASWFFRPDMPVEAYRSVLVGINEGDPMVMDQLPHADLSGEWADGMTPSKLMEQLGIDWFAAAPQERPGGRSRYDEDLEAHLCDLYCDSFNEWAQMEVSRQAEAALDDHDPETNYGAY